MAPLSAQPSDPKTDVRDYADSELLGRMLARSDELLDALGLVFDDAGFGGFGESPQEATALGMCTLALEHGQALRTLFATGCPTSAASLMRLQYEAVARAMWLVYAASDLDISKLAAPLTVESEQAAKNLPGVNEMLVDIGKRVGPEVPRAAHQMLMRFKDVQLKALNSFVHGGIHSLRRHADGFPLHMALQVIQSSNALATMAFMTMALLTDERFIADRINAIPPDFQDCLPELQPFDLQG